MPGEKCYVMIYFDSMAVMGLSTNVFVYLNSINTVLELAHALSCVLYYTVL